MEKVNLTRPKELEPLWQARMKELNSIFLKQHKRPAEHLFEDMDFLRENGLIIEDFESCETHVLTCDYPWDGTKAHFVIIPMRSLTEKLEEQDNPLVIQNVFTVASMLVERYDFKDYLLVKKSTGSINFPHWHLVVY